MKKLCVVFLTVFLAVGLLTGCFSKPDDQSGGKQSGVVVCKSCNGAGNLGKCTICKGAGYAMIKQTKVRCSGCNGSGLRICAACKGIGRVTMPSSGKQAPVSSSGKQAPAQNKNGAGGYYPTVPNNGGGNKKVQADCPICHGKGKRPCTSCHATGTLKQKKYAPNYGGGSDTSYEIEIMCPACSGTKEMLCISCGGTGKLR